MRKIDKGESLLRFPTWISFYRFGDAFTVYSNGIECLYVEVLYENPKGIGVVLDLVYGQP